MQIAIIGAGNVGRALAQGWRRVGRDITLGVRPSNVDEVRTFAEAIGVSVASSEEAAQAASTIVLALPWGAAETVMPTLGDLTGKTVIDCMNPIARTPDGMGLAVGHTSSGAEQVAQWLPGANIVKTLNQVGAEIMADTSGFSVPPVMFMAGDDDGAKTVVAELLTDLGFQPLDSGDLTKARLLEPYALVWINQAIMRGKGRNWAFAAVARTSAS